MSEKKHRDTIAARQPIYGDFTTLAETAQALKHVMREAPGWGLLSAVQREALEMNATKTARILNGNPDYPDNWHDIGGYAHLAEERCK